MRPFHDSARALAAGALALALAACVDQRGLFDPAPEAKVTSASPLLRLSTDTLALREGDRLSFRVDARGDTAARAEILLVDSARAVLWRSAAARPAGDSATVAFTGLPAEVARGRRVFLTGSLVDGRGRRSYASLDTLAAPSLAAAALQPTLVYEGRLLPVDGRVVSLAAARDLGRVYFADQTGGSIGSVDLATLAARGSFPVGAQPEALAYARGRLAVLSSNGAELAAFDAAGGERLLARSLLPPLVARMEVAASAPDSAGNAQPQRFRYLVRPYARNVALACAGSDTACPELAAFGSSEMVDPRQGSQGVGLREISFAGRPAAPFLVVPEFDRATIANDSLPAAVAVLDATVPAGQDTVVHSGQGFGRCATLASGGTAIAASPRPNGSVFVGIDRRSDCAFDVRMLRIDRPESPRPVVSTLAFRNQLGENRIDEVRSIDVSDDGSRVLVLDRDRVHMLDDALRLRASLPLPGVRAAGWLREEGAVSRFAIATDDAVEVYGAIDLVRQGRIVLGPLSDLIAFVRVNGETVVAVVPGDGKGVLVARIPLP